MLNEKNALSTVFLQNSGLSAGLLVSLILMVVGQVHSMTSVLFFMEGRGSYDLNLEADLDSQQS